MCSSAGDVKLVQLISIHPEWMKWMEQILWQFSQWRLRHVTELNLSDRRRVRRIAEVRRIHHGDSAQNVMALHQVKVIPKDIYIRIVLASGAQGQQQFSLIPDTHLYWPVQTALSEFQTHLVISEDWHRQPCSRSHSGKPGWLCRTGNCKHTDVSRFCYHPWWFPFF